ncbi:hypothetical protein Tco_1287378 [Tanacetum coccineum]
MINKCLTWKSTTHDRLRPLMLQLLWGMVTCSNVDFVNLIWEEFKYQIESKRISKRPLSFHHVIKLDSTLGNLKFVNKGSKEPIFGMVIPIVMLNDDIKAYDEYSEYLAKSRGVTSVKIRGKGLLTKQGVEIVIERVKKEEEEPLAITQSSRVVIGEVAHREPEVEGADHRKKLKGLETLYEAAQYHLNMKKARKASEHVFFIQQLAKGSREGYGVTLDVPDELVFKSSNKGAGVTPEVLDKPSDYSSSSSSDFKFGVEDISRDNEPAGDAQVDVQMTEAQPEKPEATLISSHQTLSSAEFTSQFLNDNPHITVNDMLKDPVEPEFQSMVDILVTQEKPTEPKPLLVDTIAHQNLRRISESEEKNQDQDDGVSEY